MTFTVAAADKLLKQPGALMRCTDKRATEIVPCAVVGTEIVPCPEAFKNKGCPVPPAILYVTKISLAEAGIVPLTVSEAVCPAHTVVLLDAKFAVTANTVIVPVAFTVPHPPLKGIV